jgi:hypothetical protein
MISVTERPPEISEGQRVRVRPWIIAVMVLGVAVVCLGAWVLYEQTTSSDTSGTAVTAEIDQLIDDYLRAWEEDDEAVIRAAVTQAFVINEYIYVQGRSVTNPDRVFLDEHITGDVDGVVAEGFQFEWRNEQVGEAIITGDGPWFVSFEEHWNLGSFAYEGMANYTIVDDGGVLKIANHYWAGLKFFTTE